jgi:hypothetical protein
LGRVCKNGEINIFRLVKEQGRNYPVKKTEAEEKRSGGAKNDGTQKAQ